MVRIWVLSAWLGNDVGEVVVKFEGCGWRQRMSFGKRG